MGHSMGCLALNSFLALNPEVADKVAGVIYSAPFFGIPDFVKMDPIKIEVLKLLAMVMEEFVVSSGMPMHKICRNKTYIR